MKLTENGLNLSVNKCYDLKLQVCFCPSVICKGCFTHKGPKNRMWEDNEHLYSLFKINFYQVHVKDAKHHFCSFKREPIIKHILKFSTYK